MSLRPVESKRHQGIGAGDKQRPTCVYVRLTPECMTYSCEAVVKERRQRRRDVHLGSTWTLGKVIRGNVKRDARRTKTHWCRVVVFGGSHGGTPNSVARLRHVFGVSSLAHHECHLHLPSKFFCMWYDPPLVLVSVDSPSPPPKSPTPTVKTRAQHAETPDRNASAIR